MTFANRHSLTVTLPPAIAELIRDAAQAQDCTYASMVSACVRHGLMAGAPSILEPFGEQVSAAVGVRTVDGVVDRIDWIAAGPGGKGAQ